MYNRDRRIDRDGEEYREREDKREKKITIDRNIHDFNKKIKG